MIKVMIAVVILACIAPFFINGPDGEPLMTLEDWKPDLSMPGTDQAAEEEAAPAKLYKWQDEEGVWHFSDREEDAAMAGAEEVEVSGDINIMPEFKAPPAGQSAGGTGAGQGQPTIAPTLSGGIEAMKSAADLQGTIDARKADLDEELKKAGGG